jgi:peptidyl-prolyl cis-trans isomerase A (cyclophilin A)
VVQFGLASDAQVTAKWDTSIPDDTDLSRMKRHSNVRGTIAYAMAGPNSRTTQLFVNLGNNAKLDNDGFTPIGKVLSGLEILDTELYNPTPDDTDGIDQELLHDHGNEWILSEYPAIDMIVETRDVEDLPP